MPRQVMNTGHAPPEGADAYARWCRTVERVLGDHKKIRGGRLFRRCGLEPPGQNA